MNTRQSLDYFACTLILTVTAQPAFSSPVVPQWAVGFWRLTADEDKLGVSDLMEFRADGTWRNYTPECKVSHGKLVAAGNDIIVLVERAKGPTSMVFRAQADRMNLTFTSARTGNNSTYSRVPTATPCSADP